MPLIQNVDHRYSLLTQSSTETHHTDKKTDNNLIKQCFSIKTSADKTIAISNNEGNMEINIHYPKKRCGIPLLFSRAKQKKVSISSEKVKGTMLTPSKDSNNKLGNNVNIITDLPSN